jgi:peptide methionine sulfoxide reductase msrA/msrB
MLAIRICAAFLAVTLVFVYLVANSPVAISEEPTPMAEVKVYVFDDHGRLVGPVMSPRLVLSDAEWQARLTADQFKILRKAGTERAFCGTLLDNKQEGVYSCVGCRLPLFSSEAKFDSGTGWPSFYKTIAPTNVVEHEDRSHGMVRIEIRCARCDGHLGHVFDDGPAPSGQRHCLNSESLFFTPRANVATLADSAAATASKMRQAVFAGGCFWCVEAVFEELDGVIEAVSGYAGDSRETANYKTVCSGKTRHAEAVMITYDPSKVSFEQLLRVHFATHDPTTKDRQGADVGTQYRSAIFYRDETEKRTAEQVITELAANYSQPIVTTLEPLAADAFYPAEHEHQDFVCRNPMQPYVRAVAVPKVEKLRKLFPEQLKPTEGQR